MGLVIVGLLYISLRRWTDVAIVLVALGAALLWMQGMIGHVANLSGWLGFTIIARSQFSNLLPILVLALGIDDSLHALHRYKEERKNGATTTAATEVTLTRVGRAIMLTSLTTMSAFAANLFSDVAALRSFGVEAALGILAAFLLTGLWVPLIRLSVDEWMDKRNKNISEKQMTHLVSEDLLRKITTTCGKAKPALIVGLIAALITIRSSRYGSVRR